MSAACLLVKCACDDIMTISGSFPFPTIVISRRESPRGRGALWDHKAAARVVQSAQNAKYYSTVPAARYTVSGPPSLSHNDAS